MTQCVALRITSKHRFDLPQVRARRKKSVGRKIVVIFIGFMNDAVGAGDSASCIPGQVIPIPNNVEKLQVGRGLLLNGDVLLATKSGVLRSKRAKKACRLYIDNRQKRVGKATSVTNSIFILVCGCVCVLAV